MSFREEDSVNTLSESLCGKTWGPVNTVLKKGLVKLVRKTYLKTLAVDKKPLPRRQEIPEWGFAGETEALDALKSGRVCAISYGWLSPQHPDPDGFYLQFFGHRWAITPFGSDAGFNHAWLQPVINKAQESELLFFWDWASLPQEPRNAKERQNFREALFKMHFIYGHENIKVWIWNCVPMDAHNSLPYEKRGWPLFESQVANSKPGKGLKTDLDITPVIIQNDNGISPLSLPPMTPAAFKTAISEKKFSGTGDQRKVCHLFEEFWYGHLCLMKNFQHRAGGWGDGEVQKLIATIQELPSLEEVEIGIPRLAEPRNYNIVSSHCRSDLRHVCFERGIRVMVWNSPADKADEEKDVFDQFLYPEKVGINLQFRESESLNGKREENVTFLSGLRKQRLEFLKE